MAQKVPQTGKEEMEISLASLFQIFKDKFRFWVIATLSATLLICLIVFIPLIKCSRVKLSYHPIMVDTYIISQSSISLAKMTQSLSRQGAFSIKSSLTGDGYNGILTVTFLTKSLHPDQANGIIKTGLESLWRNYAMHVLYEQMMFFQNKLEASILDLKNIELLQDTIRKNKTGSKPVSMPSEVLAYLKSAGPGITTSQYALLAVSSMEENSRQNYLDNLIANLKNQTNYLETAVRNYHNDLVSGNDGPDYFKQYLGLQLNNSSYQDASVEKALTFAFIGRTAYITLLLAAAFFLVIIYLMEILKVIQTKQPSKE